jgi:acyl dehydratase
MNSAHTAAAAGSTFDLVSSPVTTTQLVRYAGASDDYNRIHYDGPYAVEAGLGGVIAHGMLTMGFMGRAVTDWAGPRGRVKHIAARFTAPVRPGDTVTVTGTIVDRTSTGSGEQVQCTLQARVGEKTVATGEAVVAWPS